MSNVRELPSREEVEDEEARLAAAEADDDEGKTIEDLADAEPEADEGEQITLFGSEDKLTATVGRKKPTESLIKFKSRQDQITGQFGPDEIHEMVATVRVDKVEFSYVRDSDGAIIAVKRVHHATNLHVERLEERMVEILTVGGMPEEEARAIIARGTGRGQEEAA